MDIKEKNGPGDKSGMCKGPGVENCLGSERNSQNFSVAREM